ncbi:MAG TPA: hypothetical protein VES42_08340, partial [Pilimelia sp.]|nr:hypothetical protein [Pilimelia sp.]
MITGTPSAPAPSTPARAAGNDARGGRDAAGFTSVLASLTADAEADRPESAAEPAAEDATGQSGRQPAEPTA